MSHTHVEDLLSFRKLKQLFAKRKNIDMRNLLIEGGPGSSVGIATDYGLDDPGSNPGGDEIFRPSRPALGPTQPPLKWVRVFPAYKVRPGRTAEHSSPSSAAVMEK